MRSLAASIAFLTRIPVPGGGHFDAGDVGRSARWFPAVGLLIGGVYVLLLRALTLYLPPGVIAVLIVLAEALLTGALHMDALADMADGFGGGHTREDVLRIMRDHAIGSYGATALILLVALKVTAISALVQHQQAVPYLILAPALGRWSIVPLCRFLTYARESKAVANHIGTVELVWASLIAGAVASLAASWRGLVCWIAVAVITVWFGRVCSRRIGGITGDTLGANVQFSESIVLLSGLILS
ncbi:adenosylcobinamide-GDP ribazoletransferase [uncultured Paludibaculum sp.]|uniref:adenosylcobinamide-GDP ribazoletransferase n=1 Tax=uncultured Paludibaculum sp. TaxID=1765020 RepID=UPI002AABB35F|nr:adenosylcobinamide-GDP ribazoletransferase [uncultured Paludibaculum sp.]